MGVTDGDKIPGPIFCQPWWLDAVAPGTWDVAVVERDGQLVARLPYVVDKRWGLTALRMAPLTQVLGPWLQPYPGKYANQLSYEKRLMTALIERLPDFDLFQQNFHHTVTNWLPFYWQGFQQTTRYTYVIAGLDQPDVIWEGMRGNIRREIRKARKSLAIRHELALDAFLHLNEMTFARQNKLLPYSWELVHRLDRACCEKGCRKIFFAEDAQGRLHAAVYIVWDDEAAYYLMGGANPELRNSGATSLVLWEAIQFAASVTRSFDFEGSMVESIERFFRAFGARQKPYFQVSKINSPWIKIRRDVRSWIGV